MLLGNGGGEGGTSYTQNKLCKTTTPKQDMYEVHCGSILTTTCMPIDLYEVQIWGGLI